MVEINRSRLLGDLASLSRIGGRPDGSVDMVGLTEPELEARRWVQWRLQDAGMPSRGGITHSPQEHTPDEDLVNGARALLRSTQRAVAALGLSTGR